MKGVLPGYYSLTQEEFDQLWANAFLVPDTNVLLHLFRYREQQAEDVIAALKSFGDRLWLPYQAALEFQRRWRQVASDHQTGFEKLKSDIDKKRDDLVGLFSPYKRLRTWGEQGPDLQDANAAFDSLKTMVDDAYANVQNPDDTFQKVTLMFAEAVGKRPTDADMTDRAKTFEKRKKEQIPPGFRDDGAGDYLIWCEMMDFAKNKKKPIIFVTDDQKNDWWLEHRGQKIGPHPELREEFFRVTGQHFYAYTPLQFLAQAAERNENVKVTAETLKVVEEGELFQAPSVLATKYLSDLKRYFPNEDRNLLPAVLKGPLSSAREYIGLSDAVIMVAALRQGKDEIDRASLEATLIMDCIQRASTKEDGVVYFLELVEIISDPENRALAKQWLRLCGYEQMLHKPAELFLSELESTTRMNRLVDKIPSLFNKRSG